MIVSAAKLPDRWTALEPHAKQRAFYESRARFNVVEAGRRSGKTEACKRRVVRHAIRHGFNGYRCLLGAPTQAQAEAIWFDDIHALAKHHEPTLKLSKGEIWIDNGAHFKIAGLDEARRFEGVPVDRAAVDEIADCNQDVWDKTLRPLLDTKGRLGSIDFIGVPRPSRLLRKLSDLAQSGDPDWAYFHWTSEELLTPEAIAAAKRDMDPLLYEQEYRASRVAFAGRVYRDFTRLPGGNVRDDLPYLPKSALHLCFDFNVRPGVCAVIQEHELGGHLVHYVVGEVMIPVNSDTPAVCRKVIADYGKHEGAVYAYGDATGGNKGTAKVAGSDWDLIERILGGHFAGRFYLRVPKANGPERSRVNSLNARILSADGVRRLFVAPSSKAVIRDFDEVQVLAGSDGQIDKKRDPEISHISDAIGYFAVWHFPMGSEAIAVQEFY